ncbi:MAG: nucleotidyltransferase family protein [Bacteroidales bacterium]|nr:nucleotidyltransferase family protein [Bacteroidales bacterium]
MIDKHDALFHLLRPALTGSAPEAGAFVGATANEWEHLFRLLRQNHTAALASETVAALPEQEKPPRSVLIPWLSERQKATIRFNYRTQVQQEIIDLMHSHGIDTLVLKGQHLAQYYPKPELREFCDLDLYFYDRHGEADRLAREQLHVEVSNDSHHHSKYNYRDVTVESHYDFINRHTPPSNKQYEELLKSEAPSITFEVLFLLRHMAGHFASSRITLRDLCDWHVLAAQPGIDWEKVQKAVCTSGMELFVGAVSRIVSTRFGSRIPVAFDCSDSLVRRVEADTIYGNITEHPSEDWSRLWWKVKRYRANRWKHPMTYRNDPSLRLLASSLSAHAMKPHSILHKM